MVVLDLPYGLSFKVIYKFEGRTYTNHDTSPLLLHVEMQYVLPAYVKSWITESIGDIGFDLRPFFQGHM